MTITLNEAQIPGTDQVLMLIAHNGVYASVLVERSLMEHPQTAPEVNQAALDMLYSNLDRITEK
jgi:hypothetical protein